MFVHVCVYKASGRYNNNDNDDDDNNNNNDYNNSDSNNNWGTNPSLVKFRGNGSPTIVVARRFIML